MSTTSRRRDGGPPRGVRGRRRPRPLRDPLVGRGDQVQVVLPDGVLPGASGLALPVRGGPEERDLLRALLLPPILIGARPERRRGGGHTGIQDRRHTQGVEAGTEIEGN